MAEADLALIPLEQPQLDLAGIRSRCGVPRHAAEGGKLRSAQEAHLKLGPRWRVLDTRALGQVEGIADLSLPKAGRGESDHQLHPALADIATGWAMELIPGYKPTNLWVPVSYARVRVHHPLSARIVSWVRSASGNRGDGESASFDITLATPDGRVCVDIEGFSIRRLTDSGVLDAPRDGQTQPLSPAEERLQHNPSQGILPDEGAEAFARALPQVVVSSLDLDALTLQAAASSAEPRATQKFERPQLDAG